MLCVVAQFILSTTLFYKVSLTRSLMVTPPKASRTHATRSAGMKGYGACTLL